MNPLALVGPAVEPISLADAKAHLRLDGAEEDDLVAALIVAARITVERHARLALLTQSWRYGLTAWPEARAVRLPLHPVIGIDEVRLSADGGGNAVLAPALCRLDHDGDVPRLVLDDAAPDPSGRPTRIEIDFSCGFGATPGDVPEPLRLAVRRLIAHWFAHRGDDPRPGDPAMPRDIAALIAPFACPRLA